MALFTLSEATTALIERSLEPWAIAATLMLAWARALKNFAETPRLVRMPSPTTLMMAMPSRTSSGSRIFSRNSSTNSVWRASTALSRSAVWTQKQIEYSEDDWVMSATEIPALEMQLKILPAMPTTPFMPGPDTFMRLMLSRSLMPFIG